MNNCVSVRAIERVYVFVCMVERERKGDVCLTCNGLEFVTN
jgi:hypothetical protein